MDSIIIHMAVALLLSVIKNPSRAAAVRDALIALRDTLNDVYPAGTQ